VGLAAPQIGKSIRLAVVDVTLGKIEAKIVLVDPEIIHAEGEVRRKKGAFRFRDFADMWCAAVRDGAGAECEGETFEIRGENLLARAFCHEIDHLHGILFLTT